MIPVDQGLSTIDFVAQQKHHRHAPTSQPQSQLVLCQETSLTKDADKEKYVKNTENVLAYV